MMHQESTAGERTRASSWASPRCAVRPVVNGSGRGSPGGFVYTGLLALGLS